MSYNDETAAAMIRQQFAAEDKRFVIEEIERRLLSPQLTRARSTVETALFESDLDGILLILSNFLLQMYRGGADLEGLERAAEYSQGIWYQILEETKSERMAVAVAGSLLAFFATLVVRMDLEANRPE
jgi:hypothetical protein